MKDSSKTDKEILFSRFIPQDIEFEDYPFRVIWRVTQLLNEKNRKKKLFELNTDESSIVIDQLSVIDKPFQFIIGAFNPFIREDFMDIINYSIRRGLIPTIYIFNKYITKENSELLKKAGIKEIFVVCNDDDLEFQRSLLILTELGFDIHVRYEIQENNIHKTGIVFQECKDYRVKSFILYFSHDKEKYQIVSQSDLEDLFGFLYCSMIDSEIYIETDNAPQYRRYIIERYMKERYGKIRPPLENIILPGIKLSLKKSSFTFNSFNYAHNEIKMKTHGLNDGDGMLFIDYDGRILPSPNFPVDSGNIKTNNLIEVYRNSNLFKQLRARRDIKGKCRDCPYIFICGGSRERAYNFTGDFLREEPLCPFLFNRKLNR